MKIVYASRTGNVQSIIDKLGLSDAINVNNTDTIAEDFIVFTYTDGYGDIPSEVEEFLEKNSSYLKGVVVSGSTGYGEAYGLAGDKIAEKYNVPLLYKVEEAGTEEDIENIRKCL